MYTKSCARIVIEAPFLIENKITLGTTQLPLNRKTDKLIVAYSCSGVLFNSEND